MTNMTNAVNRHLKITWTSAETTAEVSDVMDRAEVILGDLLGCTFDAEPQGYERQLYLDLCLYLYNGLTVDEFTEAYGRTLTIARQKHVDPVDTEDEDEDQ